MKRYAALLVIALIGCDGGGGPGALRLSTSAAPSTTVRTATVGQLAGIIAKYEGGLRVAARRTAGCAVDYARCSLTDRVHFALAHATATNLRLELDAADDPTARGGFYLGAYPAEVDALARATVRAADEVVAATEPFAPPDGPCAGDRLATECPGRALLADGAIQELVRQLDAWRPYL